MDLLLPQFIGKGEVKKMRPHYYLDGRESQTTKYKPLQVKHITLL